MYTLERFYIISKFFKSENDRNARPTTHNISQQRQKEFLLKDVMKLHEGHEFMEKILRANDFSRRLRTVLLRAALRVDRGLLGEDVAESTKTLPAGTTLRLQEATQL